MMSLSRNKNEQKDLSFILNHQLYIHPNYLLSPLIIPVYIKKKYFKYNVKSYAQRSNMDLVAFSIASVITKPPKTGNMSQVSQQCNNTW